MQRTGEMIAMGVIAVLIAVGGRQLLGLLGHDKTWGALIAAALVFVAVRQLRNAYDPALPEARVEVTRAGAYFVAALLTLIAVLVPQRWAFGSCIVAAEIAIVFDIITLAARSRAAGGN
jgi:predicted NBD/HSP70 family sugar kinase